MPTNTLPPHPVCHPQAVGVPLPEFREIKCSKCAEGAGRAFGYPYMLKSKK